MLLVASNRRRGAEVFGERLTEGLGSLGWAVDFVAVQAADTDRVVPATPLAPSSAGGRLNPGTIMKLRRRLASHRPAIVLANGGATLRYAVAARLLMRNRPLLAYGSIGEPRYWLRSRRHVRLQTFFHKRPDVVLAVSEMTRSQLISDLGVEPNRAHVAPTGVPPEFFSEKETHDGPLRLLFLGSLSPEKDPLAAVEVAASVGRHRPVHLCLVGAGPLQGEVERHASTLSEQVTIELTGSLADVKPHLRWADLLLLTSKTEGLPGAVLEAGAAGVPAVAFDVGGTRETMIPGESGVVVAPGDTAAMATHIEDILSDLNRVHEMAQRQRAHVRQNYSLAAAIERYDQILTTALGGRA